jgi:hypothetical protein
MKTIVKFAGLGLLFIGVGIQFIRPERTNPAEDPSKTLAGNAAIPASVRDILDRSCMDCHSNRTRWPWYSNVAPASWLVVSDVQEARKELNFSEWGDYKTRRKIARLEMLMSEVDEGGMPPRQYLLAHGNAALTEEQKTIVCDWAEHLSDSLKATGE